MTTLDVQSDIISMVPHNMKASISYQSSLTVCRGYRGRPRRLSSSKCIHTTRTPHRNGGALMRVPSLGGEGTIHADSTPPRPRWSGGRRPSVTSCKKTELSKTMHGVISRQDGISEGRWLPCNITGTIRPTHTYSTTDATITT